MPNFRQPVIRNLTRTLLMTAAVSLGVGLGIAQSGWTPTRVSSSGRDLNAVYFVDSKHGWIGGDNGFLTHTEDGGASWIEQRIDTKQRAINDIYFANKDVGFALAGDTIFRSSDSGHTWQESHKISAAEV